MIDEKKLIETIVNTPSKHQDDCCLEFLEGMATRQHEILDIIKEQPKADWITYTEGNELPYNGQKVWISFTNEVCSYVKQAWWIYDHFEWDNGKRVKDYPTAWMPYIVPQPYKKEGAENGWN